MTRKLFLLAVAACLLTAGAVHAQISEGGVPPSFTTALRADIGTITTRSIDVPALMAQDTSAQSKDEPLRFGYPFDVDYDLNNSGTWDTLPDGGRLWRLEIQCPGAYSINLVYRAFWLPPGAKLYIYSADHSYVIGAFTERNNKDYGKFATAPVPGDACVLEYYEPASASSPGIIDIQRIVHAYRNLFDRSFVKDALDFGSSGSCNNNVNCPEGADWQDDKRAVAMILTSGGFRLCTGSLVNNVREDLTNYFLTANHCLGGEATWVFMFNYESPTCSNINGPTYMTVSGSTLRANNAYSDFALLELSETPPDSYYVYYAGWSAVDVAAQSEVCIHHPSGDIKKITFDYDPVVSSNYGGSSGGSHWRVIQWDDGTTEPGSSGSPLFDSLTHRIIGQLHGGTASCASLTSDYFGKFAKSWNYGSTAATRLKDWLDPDNTGTLELDGIDPQGVTFTGAPRYGSVPLDVQFTGSSLLAVDTWTYDFGDGDSAFVQSPLHTYTDPGIYDVKLEVTAGGETKMRARNDYIIALADTARAADTTTSKFTSLVMTVYETNTISIRQFILPVMYTGTLDLTLDSFSTVGCRTDYFEVQDKIHSYAAGKQATIRLISSNSETSPDLPPGSGPVMKLHFHTGAAAIGDTAFVDLDGYSTYLPSFSGPLLTYTPVISSATVIIPACCSGLRGNVDGANDINVADLTYLVSYIFQLGPAPLCYEEADVDGSGAVNVSDVTYLVAFLFQGGPDPAPCP